MHYKKWSCSQGKNDKKLVAQGVMRQQAQIMTHRKNVRSPNEEVCSWSVVQMANKLETEKKQRNQML